MYGVQLEEAQVELGMKLACLGVPVLSMIVGEGGPLGLGASRKAGEDGVLQSAGECGDGPSRFWVVLAVVTASERLRHSN